MRSLYLAGRCANGSELDSGTLFHAVPDNSRIALCGAKPGRRSAGWRGDDKANDEQGAVSCKRCLAKLNARVNVSDLVSASRGLIEYRRHNTLNFQLEKLGDFIRQTEIELDD